MHFKFNIYLCIVFKIHRNIQKTVQHFFSDQKKDWIQHRDEDFANMSIWYRIKWTLLDKNTLIKKQNVELFEAEDTREASEGPYGSNLVQRHHLFFGFLKSSIIFLYLKYIRSITVLYFFATINFFFDFSWPSFRVTFWIPSFPQIFIISLGICFLAHLCFSFN